MVKVGLIGFGLAGQFFHAPTIRAVPGMQLACILERRGSLAQQKHPDVRVARTLEELLADEQIRVVVVATPNPTHFDLTRQCLLAGRDVVVDKPFTVTYKEAAELVQFAERHRRLLTVYQNRRWDGDFHTVRKLIDSCTLGRLVAYESHYDRYRPQFKQNAWREIPSPGSGILYDLSPHLIDQAFGLFGPPQAITAHVFQQRDRAEVDDGFDLRLEYPGMSVALRSSMLAYVKRPRFLLHGTKGSFIKYGMDPQEEPLRRGEALGGPGWGEEPEEKWGALHLANGETGTVQKVKTEVGDYRGFYANVRDAVQHGAPLAVTPRQALDVMRALELALASNKQRRTLAWDTVI